MALIQIERLKRLPLRRDHVWQTALVRRPTRVTQEAKPYRPYVAIWVAINTGKVRGRYMCLDPDHGDSDDG